MNPGTLAVLAVLVIIVGLIIYKMIKDKKSGKSSCSCGGSCSGCGMAGSCHNAAFGSDKTGTVPVEDREVVKHITLKIDGMMCGMCESHINDAIRSALSVRKLKTSHATGISEFYTDDVVSDERLRAIIEKTGYKLLNVEREYI